MKNNYAPEIRFLRFTGDWEELRLNKVFKEFIVPMRDKPKEFSGTVPWTRIEDIEGRFINGTTSGQYVSEETIKSMNLKIIPKGSLIVSASATFGVVAIVNNDLITNQTFIGLVPNTNYNIDYLYAFFKSTDIQKKMKRESAGSTIFYISRKQFENMIGKFPGLKEQEKIGDLFKQLDDTIALYEQELTILKQTKQGFLQKMFPKEGESVPEVRFPGFTGNWEKRRLGDIYDVVSGFAFKMSDYVRAGVPIINGESIQHGSISTKNLNFLPEEFLDKYPNFILNTGDIVLGLNRPITNGNLKIAQVPKDLHGALLYQRAGKIIFLNNSDINFSYQLLGNEVSKFVLKEAVGSDQPFISTTKLKKWLIRIPALKEEQTKIGLFFKKLDDTIALHQHELDSLKETKKAFLQKMFV
ncbi:restriction endonuclease subunit S [Priestia megaterium]|uniref:restriction endonuclease subunit S n=1 Tax=Priestia megaterium TaxID=1404 RepID=UPI0021B4300A|nr:restriction endonuclease subunit S [Priestia megaterium]